MHLDPRNEAGSPSRRTLWQSDWPELERENRRLENQLKQARTIIEVQKKLSEILGIAQPDLDDDGSNS